MIGVKELFTMHIKNSLCRKSLRTKELLIFFCNSETISESRKTQNSSFFLNMASVIVCQLLFETNEGNFKNLTLEN